MSAAALRLARPTLRAKPAFATSLGSGLSRSLARPTPPGSTSIKPSALSRSSPLASLPLTPGARPFSLWSSRKDEGLQTIEPAPAPAPAPETSADALASAVGDVVDADAGGAAEAVASSTDTVQGAASGAADALSHAEADITAAIDGAMDAVHVGSDPSVTSAVSEFAAAGLPNGWLTVPYMQQLLEYVTLSTGLPWWQVIVGTVVVAKVLLLPVTIRGMRSAARLASIQPHMQRIMNNLTVARQTNNQTQITKASDDVKFLMIRNGVNPLAPMVPVLFNTPIFVTLFFAIDYMAHAGLATMTTGGGLWFTNLNVPDPYMILPIATSVSQLISIELGQVLAKGMRPVDPAQRLTRNIIRGALLVTPLFIRNFPAAVLLMWATNAILTAVQTIVLSSPAMKARLGTGTFQPVLPPAVPAQAQTEATATIESMKHSDDQNPFRSLSDRLAEEKQRTENAARDVKVRAPANPEAPAFTSAQDRATAQMNRQYQQATLGANAPDHRPVLAKRSARRSTLKTDADAASGNQKPQEGHDA